MSQQIIIIGGGAAGFFAAITCAEANPNTRVTILERGREVLGKVKVSGGGRCNVTHACFDPRELIQHYPRGSKALLGPFHRFACGDTVEWFEQRGVPTKIEADGRMFPTTDNSQTIMDCLQGAAQNAGVKVQLQSRVEAILPPTPTRSQWLISVAKAPPLLADKVMLATGSNPKIWQLLGHLGHSIIPPVPSLFTFNIKDERIEELAGVAIKNAAVQIPGTKLSAQGPLLVTHWGMSGPGILRLSAWGARILHGKNYQFTVLINWLGETGLDEIQETLQGLKRQIAAKQVAANPQFNLPARLWKKLVAAAKIPVNHRWGDLSKKQLNALVRELGQGAYEVKGKSTFKEEFVTAGGVSLKSVNFKRFESKLFPNLFFAGEVLDIDAITGGFNFQAAWTGGWIAGLAMAEMA